MILPRVKEYQENGRVFTAEICYNAECEKATFAAKLLGYYLPAVSLNPGEDLNIFFEKEKFQVKGAYRLSITETEITITYGDEESIHNAIASLAQLWTGGGFTGVEIYDAPDDGFRSVMVDFGRGYVEIPVLKELLVRASLLKYNYAHFHLMDDKCFAMESDIVPSGGIKTYSKQEMKEMVAFCKELGLTVIPEIEVPGHARSIIQAMPELQCDIIDMKKAQDFIAQNDSPLVEHYIDPETRISNWAVCAGKESTYEIYRKIIAELVEVFDGPYFHIGGDEIRMRNHGANPHWDNCHACKALMEKEGITDFRGMVYYVFRRVNEIVKSFGKQTIIWNDQVEVTKPIDLPDDIIVQFWFSHMITGDVGVAEHGVLQKLLDQGFTTINSNVAYAYMDLPDSGSRMSEKKIEKWNTQYEFLDDPQLEGNILGGETCVWEMGNPEYFHYPYTLPVAITLFADRLWNHTPYAYDKEYRYAVASIMFGNPGKIDPFVFFKEILPPREIDKDIVECIDKDAISMEELEKIIAECKAMDEEKIYGKLARKAYIDCLTKIKESL